MATFRCLVSNQTVTFTYQHDIDSMKGHQGYVLVEETPKEVEEKPKSRLGRPKKEVANVGN
jgi:hypothetical protein